MKLDIIAQNKTIYSVFYFIEQYLHTTVSPDFIEQFNSSIQIWVYFKYINVLIIVMFAKLFHKRNRCCFVS